MRDRRIIVGLLVVLVLGGAALGYLWWRSRRPAHKNDAQAEKRARAREYKRLVRRIRAGECDAAFEEIEAFRKRYPKLGAAWNLKAFCTEQRGDTKEALALYREALRRSPKHVMFLSNVAKSCFRLDDLDCSLRMVRRIRGISKRHALVMQHLVTSPPLRPYKPQTFEGKYAKELALAIGYLESGYRIERALPILQQALKDNPDDLVVVMGLVAHQGKLGRWLPAKEYLKRALTIAAKKGVLTRNEPASIPLQLLRAVIFHRSGEYRVAVKVYRAILAKQPNNLDALYGLAAVLHNQGHKSDALDIYKKLKALDAKRAARLFTILSQSDR